MSDPAVTVIALLVAGYLLMAAEIFLIPGFGVAGVGGLILLAAGCYFAYQYFGAAYGGLTIVLVLVSVTAVVLWIPKSRFGKDVVHSTALGTSRASETRLAPGDIGLTESDLRPSGVARFGELRQSVVTEGEYIDSGSRIVVTEVHGSRIVVEQAPEEKTEPT